MTGGQPPVVLFLVGHISKRAKQDFFFAVGSKHHEQAGSLVLPRRNFLG